MGGFESDSDGRQTKKRDAHEARTPGRHANTDALAGNSVSVPQPNIPGKRSGTEHLAPPSDPGVPGEYASSSVFGGPGDQHTAPTTTSAAPAATSQPAPAAHGPVTAADFRVDTWTRDANGSTRRGEDAINQQGRAVYRFYSSGIHAHASVTALTPAAQAYNVGFLQTMHSSTRRAMYVDSDGQVIGTYEAVQHNPVMDTRTDLHSPRPWYNWSLPLGSTTKSPSMTDNPRFEVPQWSDDDVGQPQDTDGGESFTTYLVAMQGNANPIYLGNLSWSMNWRGRFSGRAFHGQAASLGATNRSTDGNAMLTGSAANDQGTARYTPAPAAAPASTPAAAASTPVAAARTGRQTNHHGGVHAGAYGGGILGTMRDATASAQASAEKKEADDAKPTPDKIQMYLLHNQVDVWRTVGDHLNNIFLPTPNERLTWDRPDVFHAAILDELVKGVGNFKPLSKLDEVFVPSNAMKVVGPNLPTTVDYSIEVGMVIAHELHLVIVESIKRLGKRYLEILDSQGADSGKAVTFEQLVLSKPIDRYVGKVLCSPGIVKATALEGKAAEAAKGKDVGRKPITKITLEGERDPKLWNWIRVEPIDATVEDVAAELFKRGNTHDKHGDANAYMLAAAPPLFGLPKKQALEMPQFKQIAQQFMFRGGMGLVFDVDDSVDKQLLQIANSSAVDAVAHEPNGGRVDENIQRAPAELGQVQEQLRDCDLQLNFIKEKLTPWALADKLGGAFAYVKRQKTDLPHADQKKLGDVSAIVDGQKGRLSRIAGAINGLASASQQLGAANPKSDEAAPLREILELLAVAAGTSHITQASEPKLIEAMQLQTTLSVRALQATERNMIGATKYVHQQAGDNLTTGNLSHAGVDLQEQSRKLQSDLLNGQEVDPESLEDVSLRSEEVALESRLYGTLEALKDINEAASTAGKGDAAIIASLFSGAFRDLPSLTKHISNDLHPVLGNLKSQFRNVDDELKRGVSSAARKRELRDVRRKIVADAQSTFSTLQTNHDLQHFFKDASAKIKNQQLRAAIVRAAAFVGISIVAGAVAEFAASGMASMFFDATGATQVSELGLTARATIVVTRSAVDSAVNAIGTANDNQSFVEAWEQNMIMTLASHAVFGSMAEYAKQASKQDRVEEELLQSWTQKQAGKLAKFGKTRVGELIKGAGAISVHTLWGAAMAEVAGRIVTGKVQPSAQTMTDWAIQGGSMFLGRAISSRIGANKKLYKEIDETISKTERGLAMKAAKLQALADLVAESKDPSKALELLGENEKFMKDQIEELERAIAKTGDPTGELALHKSATEAALQENKSAGMLDAKFALTGLKELVPGALWTGTHEDIRRAINQADNDGHKPKVLSEPSSKRWRIQLGERVIEVQETESAGTPVAEETDRAPRSVETKQPASSDGDLPKGASGPTASSERGPDVRAPSVTHDSHQAPPSHHPPGKPARTRYGDVWPGEVPSNATPADHAVFEAAKKIFEGLKRDGFQGGAAARVAWEWHLSKNGIAIEGFVHDGGTHEIHEHQVVPGRSAAPSDIALPAAPAMGTRSHNTGHVTRETSVAALNELLARGTTLKGVRNKGHGVLEVPLANGKNLTVTVAEPRPTADGEMAAVKHAEHGDTVWVSDRLTDEQVPRALGAVIGESLARAGKGYAASSSFGELDAMFAHRDAVEQQEQPKHPGPDAKPEDIKKHAAIASRAESTARIDAEIDLALSRLGVVEPGPAREEKLAAMPAELAQKVRARLQQHGAIGFHEDAVITDGAVARPRQVPTTTLDSSKVFPDAPAQIRAYSKADYSRVMELRVEFAVIKEIDARTALRDQPGTAKGSDIARGETRRRAEHVARARELLSELQLGGGDNAYLEARLKELAAVFPGVEQDLVPAVQQRMARRSSAEAEHNKAEAFRAERTKQQAEVLKVVLGQRPFTTKRLVVGDGMSAIADVATLHVARDGEWINPSDLLVIGKPDLLELLDAGSQWGQRGGAFDRPNDAHPAFSDDQGHGTGDLMRSIEDPGEFMHVGEVRDAMDVARKRLGIVAIPGEVAQVETIKTKRPDAPEWEVDPQKYPVRAKAALGGADVYVYSEYSDLIPGPGRPRMPNEQILSAKDRDTLMDPQNGSVLFSGEKLLELQQNVRGKRVLVMSLGPTGGWTAKAAANAGAARVDFAGSAGGELGSGTKTKVSGAEHKRPPGKGPVTEETPGNDLGLAGIKEIDRLQDVLDGEANVHITLDRIIHIEPSGGGGAIVTYAHGAGESAEVYQVHYDAIAMTMGYTQGQSIVDPKTASRMVGADPTVKDMIGDMKMVPQRGTQAPVTEDAATGRVRVMGIAAGAGVNVDRERDGKRRSDAEDLRQRGQVVAGGVSADSPNADVLEGTGEAIRLANDRETDRK